jgi:hypothetical protein
MTFEKIGVNIYCQIEYVSSDSDIGTPCGKRAVVTCADCGVAICSECRLECCGDLFCEPCYDYHVTNSCVRKPVQHVRHSSREHSDLGPKICGVNVFCHSPSFWSGVAQAKDSLVRAA